jgi:hypothetical protein
MLEKIRATLERKIPGYGAGFKVRSFSVRILCHSAEDAEHCVTRVRRLVAMSAATT